MTKPLNLKNKKILITGANGFLGKHLVRKLKESGYVYHFTPSSKEFDLRSLDACRKVVKGMDIVIHLAAKVGGIGYNLAHPAEMFYDNILMGTQLLHQAYLSGVEKFVAVGTICCYPKYAHVPFREEDLWNGYPEETNAPYGLAKKMLLVQSQAYHAQYGFNSIFLLPVNLYGPGDNFNEASSHVIPALIKKIYEAKLSKKPKVTVWGSGRPTREFIYVEDAAKAIIQATEKYNKPDPINIGTGFEISIKNLAKLITKHIGFKGKLAWDTSKPDGQPRRMLDTSKAKKEFGFVATTPFEDGLRREIAWYEQHLLGK